MRVLLVGQGGREHALAWALSRSPSVEKLVCAPGRSAMETLAKTSCLPVAAEDLDGLVDAARELRPQLAVIGPEQPLVEGLADRRAAEGVAVLGPGREGAQLEGSKAFAKHFMRRCGIPTADFAVFDDAEQARKFIRDRRRPCVVKADGLAAGKGVFPCADEAEALQAVEQLMVEGRFGSAGKLVVIEDFLEGEEASLLALCDGENILPLASCQDHKRVFDGDRGPNTGGMGAYSPAPVLDDKMQVQAHQKVLQPLLEGLRRDGIGYRGIIYAGLMFTAQGPMVLEFNVRFGDPETQPLMLRLKSDLAAALELTARGRLGEVHLEWDSQPAVCVVMASGGYPGDYRKGLPIEGLQQAEDIEGAVVFHAGTSRRGEKFVTAGGRVLNVCARGKDLPQALARAYRAAECIKFEGAHFRRDIAARALRR